MNIFLKLIYLLLILTLNFSCVENKTSENQISESEFEAPTKIDTLKFTSSITAIFQDNNQNYWIGSQQEGVCLFNGNSFEYFTTNDGLADNQIRSIQEDINGNVWFSTANGISSYDGKKIITHTNIATEDSDNEWIKTDNDLWFSAGNKAGVYRYDGQKLYYLAFPNPKIINPDNTYFVTSISAGKNNMCWIATYAGVFGYNGNKFTIINNETLELKKETGILHIRSIFEDSKGRLWIGNNGIGVLLKENDTIINFSEKNNLIHPTSSRGGDKSEAGTLEHVFAIEEDADGNIWFGDRDAGAWKYDGKTMTNYTKKDGLSDNFPRTIYRDNDNKLWFGLADGKIYLFNGKTFDRRF